MKTKSIDDLLTSPWMLWAISVTAAVLMWFYVVNVDEANYVSRKFACPLEYRSLDPQTVLRSRVSEVDVEIRGLERDVALLDYNQISCYVDAKNLAAGMRYTQNVNVQLPPDITLVSCVPSQVVLDLVRQVSRLMPVEVALPKNIPEGQYLEGVEVTPREITIHGTEGDVAKVGSLQVIPTVAELQSGKELLLPVKFNQSEPFEGSVVLEPPQARVRGALVRGLPKKRVPVNVRLSGKPAADFEVRSVLTEPLEVSVEGETDRLTQVAAVDTETVDISLLSADQTIVVPLRAPEVEGTALSGVKSVRLTLRFSEMKAGKQLANVPIRIQGGGGAAHWTVSPSSAVVTIESAPSRMENITGENIGLDLYVDLSGIYVTPVDLPVRWKPVSGDYRVIKIEPSTVTVNAAESLERW